MAVALLLLLVAAREPVEIDRWTSSFYFPSTAAPGEKVPLVVYLHGCQQIRWHSEKTTRLHEWAEKLRFAVLMPEQNRLRNPWKCWNWFLGEDQPEMDEVVELVEEYQAKYPLLRSQTYVMGLSAGGVMTAHLLACRPDVFRAGAVFAGAAFGMLALPDSPGDDVFSGASLQTRAQLAKRAWRCMKRRTGVRPVDVLVVQGGRDRIARPRNGEQVAAQFSGANHLLVRGEHGLSSSLVPVGEERVEGPHRPYTRARYASGGGARVELVRIDGLGHQWSGGPGWLPFSDAEGPDGTRLALEFFGLTSRTGAAETHTRNP